MRFLHYYWLYYGSPARIMSHYLHQHKINHHEAFLTNEMSIAVILKWGIGVNANLEQFDMPESKLNGTSAWSFFQRKVVMHAITSKYSR